MLANFSNQKWEICVSTSPLRGMPLGMMQSNAEMRSVATMSSESPRSNSFADFAAADLWNPRQINLQQRLGHAARMEAGGWKWKVESWRRPAFLEQSTFDFKMEREQTLFTHERAGNY